MPVRKISFPKFLSELRSALRGRNVVFLTGAGVSMLPPSSLPSGAALKDMAVSGLCECPELKKYWPLIRIHPRYRHITPEILFQRFHACLDKNFAPFFDVLRPAAPNEAHRGIHTLAARGQCKVLTTNFDLLIESAGSGQPVVSHLHGALTSAEAMVTRIHQVGQGVTRKTLEKVRRTLAGRTLCVLGYSGNDNDIAAAVHESEPAKILWLVRDSHDWAWQNLERFSRRHELLVAPGDLHRFAKQLRSPLPRTGPPDSAVQLEERRRALRAWSALPRLVDRYACLSELFFEIEDYRHAAEISREAFAPARRTELGGWFRIQAADAMKIMGDFAMAERLVKQAIRINTRLGDPFDIAGAYNNFGLLQVEKATPEPRRGVRALRRALEIVNSINLVACSAHRQEGLLLFKGRVLNNLGLAYSHLGDADQAGDFYKRSLKVKRRLGDLLGTAVTAGNISIIHFGAARRKPAARWRQTAFDLMDKYDLRSQKAFVLRETGRIACRRGDRSEGKAMLMEALAIYTELRDTRFGIRLTKAALKACKSHC